MGDNFLAEGRDQLYLLPPSVADWLPEDDLGRLLLDAVEEMGLSAFYADYRQDGWGGAAHHPRDHGGPLGLRLLPWDPLEPPERAGLPRRRGVPGAVRQPLPRPHDHRQVPPASEEALEAVDTASLQLCHNAGMVKLGVAALDGKKIAAPAAIPANRTCEAIAAEVDKMLAEAEATDAAEDAEREDGRGDETPAELLGRAEREAALAAGCGAESRSRRRTRQAPRSTRQTPPIPSPR